MRKRKILIPLLLINSWALYKLVKKEWMKRSHKQVLLSVLERKKKRKLWSQDRLCWDSVRAQRGCCLTGESIHERRNLNRYSLISGGKASRRTFLYITVGKRKRERKERSAHEPAPLTLWSELLNLMELFYSLLPVTKILSPSLLNYGTWTYLFIQTLLLPLVNKGILRSLLFSLTVNEITTELTFFHSLTLPPSLGYSLLLSLCKLMNLSLQTRGQFRDCELFFHYSRTVDSSPLSKTKLLSLFIRQTDWTLTDQ